MVRKGTVVIPKRDLISQDRSKSFIKGKEYTTTNDANHLENSSLIDEQGDPHNIGHWFTEFKIKK